MDYDELIKNYSPELQLMDALDFIKDRPWEAAEILDQLVFDSNTEKTDAVLLQKDQVV